MLQVTITAEQECLYMCWPRLKLERVLRHRPLLKVVLSNIIGELVHIGVVTQKRQHRNLGLQTAIRVRPTTPT
jgi:hypothetical protein